AKEKNGNFYDAFRKRVIFPIRDGRGRIVGFGGRVLDDSKPKYLNSPETPIFNKRHILFALDMAQPAIYKEGCAILVEGYMDVVSAHNRGITNVVASLGTAFTTEQARLLQRQAAQLVLAYDMDAAGRQATMRAMEIVRGLHVSIRVLSLGQGKDPDEYITTVGPDAFRQAVAAAPNTLDYMLQTALQTYDSTVPEGKSAIMASIMPAVARIDDRIVLEAFLTKAAQRLQVEETAVRSEFNRFVERHPELKQGKLVITPHLERRLADSRGTDVMAAAEENILRYLMEYPHTCERIQEMIPYTLFVNPLRQHIYQFILDAYAEKRTYTKADIQDRLSVEEEKELARIMVLQDVPLDERVLNDYVKRFHLAGLQRQYAEHSKRAAAFSRTGDPQVMKELAICKEINEKIRKWSCRGERS
ncbi:MAG: DNA primase, partial [Megasphaera lornae]